MSYQKSYKEFMKEFSFKDTKKVYSTDGVELIAVHRVEEMLERYFAGPIALESMENTDDQQFLEEVQMCLEYKVDGTITKTEVMSIVAQALLYAQNNRNSKIIKDLEDLKHAALANNRAIIGESRVMSGIVNLLTQLVELLQDIINPLNNKGGK